MLYILLSIHSTNNHHTFHYQNLGDFVNGKLSELDLIQFCNDNLTPDFTLDFLGFQITPLSVFIPTFIATLQQNKILNNVPGVFNYILLNESTAILRNNELVTSVDFPTNSTPFDLFEALQFTNFWTLRRKRPFKIKPWKLSFFSTVLDIRFPTIGNGSAGLSPIYPVVPDVPAVPDKPDKPNNHDNGNYVIHFPEQKVYFGMFCVSTLVILLIMNTFCLYRIGSRGIYKYSAVKTIVPSDEDTGSMI